MKKILVTGGAGFIGSHLVDRLIKLGHKVVVIDNLSTGKKENLNKESIFYEADIQGPELGEVFAKEKPEIIFHLAGQINIRRSVKDPIKDAKINILGTLNLLENSRKQNVEKFIFSSTGGAIYGDTNIIPTPENHLLQPVSPYGVGKLAVEKYLYFYRRVYGLSFVSLRYANIYGPRQNPEGEAGVVAIFCNKISKGEQPIINGDGKQTRDFVYVEDAVEANILSLRKGVEGSFNIGSGKETSINTIFEEIKRALNSDFEKTYGPAKTAEQRRSCLDFSKAKAELNWEPKIGLRQGIEKTCFNFCDKMEQWQNKKKKKTRI